MNIEALRREYKHGELKEENLQKDPFVQFVKWFDQALNADILDVNAMTLATSSIDGKPAARIVLLKEFSGKGFTFFTNFESRKGTELSDNPQAAILFYWKELDRQIRIEGQVQKAAEKAAVKYFDSRSLESRISAVVSPQSKPVESRRWLEERWVDVLKQMENEAIQKPAHWGGFVLKPETFEFWQGRPNRLHDRICYHKISSGWKIERLAP